MSRTDDGSLSRLASVKRLEERTAAVALGTAQQRLDDERARLVTVQRYVGEYRGRPSDAVSGSRQLWDGQSFLLELERSLESQRAAVEREQGNVESARARWLAVRMQREAIDKLLDRRAEEAGRRRSRDEQRQTDERASNWGQSPFAPAELGSEPN